MAICGTDPHIIAGDYPGFWPKEFPFIPGHEWVGEVVELGPGAADLGWETGTRVAGTSHAGCGYCRLCVEGRYNLCENFGDERLHSQYGHYTQGSYADYVVHSVKSVFARAGLALATRRPRCSTPPRSPSTPSSAAARRRATRWRWSAPA